MRKLDPSGVIDQLSLESAREQHINLLTSILDLEAIAAVAFKINVKIFCV